MKKSDYVTLTNFYGGGEVILHPAVTPNGFVEVKLKKEGKNSEESAVSIHFPGSIHTVNETVASIIEEYEQKRPKIVEPRKFDDNLFGYIDESAFKLFDKGTRPTKLTIGEEKFKELIDLVVPKEEQTGAEFKCQMLVVVTKWGTLLCEASTNPNDCIVS